MSESIQTPEPEPTPTPQPENHAVEVLDSEGKFTEAFRESLGDDLGKHSLFDKYGNFTEMVKGFANTQKMVGQKAEEFLTSDDPEIVAKRNSILGVPDDPTGYEVNVEIPEELDKEQVQAGIEDFKKFAAEKGWPKEMVQQAIEYDLTRGTAQLENGQHQYQESLKEAEKKLRAEWSGNKYDYNLAKVKDSLEYLGLGEWINDPAIANNPTFIKDVFDKIVPLTSDDDIIEARQNQSYATISDQLAILESDMLKWNGSTSDPAYQKMVSNRAALLQKLPKKA